MASRRLRTKHRKTRDRAEFWDRHGDTLRLTLIGASMAAVASAVIWLFVNLV